MKDSKTIDSRFIPVRRLEGRFIVLCWEWMGKNRAKPVDLARELKIHASRLYELLNEDPKKRRPLTMFWVAIFIKKGVLTVSQLYDEKPDTQEEREEWDYLKTIEDSELQREITMALNGTLEREILIQMLKTHQKKPSNIIKPI
jgi:hypothetical protein